MQNVLAQIPITKWDREIRSFNLLINMSRVIDFWSNSDGYTEFYYQDIADRKDKVSEFTTSYILSTFETFFEETEPNPFITVNVDKWNLHPIGHRSPGYLTPFPFSHQKFNINLDYFVKALARPSSETGSYIWVARGAFNFIVLRSRNTLNEINTTSSVSGSLGPN
jgi:hypothetical protein